MESVEGKKDNHYNAMLESYMERITFYVRKIEYNAINATTVYPFKINNIINAYNNIILIRTYLYCSLVKISLSY
jgi:hypothetical protein